MTPKFSLDMTLVFQHCKEEAVRLHNDTVTPAHLLLGILRQKDNNAQGLLRQLNADLPTIRKELEHTLHATQSINPIDENNICMDQASNRIMRLCLIEAKLSKTDTIDTEHMLLAILKENENEASNILGKMNIGYDDIARALTPSKDVKDGYEFGEDEEGDEEEEDRSANRRFNRQNTTEQNTAKQERNPGGTGGKTPVLDNFGTDLTQAAEEGLLDPVIGREKEIERVAQILSRRKKNNPILIGQPGVGKSAIVEGLAQRIVQHKINHMLWDKRIIVLDMAAVVAGTKYRGQFEERIRAIIQELKKNPDIIIFIDEIHTLIGAGSAAGTMDAANMLKPALARGEVQCVGATTIDEYRKTIEKDGALERRFQKIIVDATTTEETLLILQNLQGRYEEHHHIKYSKEAIQACVNLTERYISDRPFPDKAIDAMDEAGSRIHLQTIPLPPEIQELESNIAELNRKKQEAVKSQNFEQAAEYRDQLTNCEEKLRQAKKEWEKNIEKECPTVEEKHIEKTVSLMTGIPVQRIGNKENERLRNLAHTLQEKVIGQDEAIATLVRAIQRNRVGLKDPNKPIGTFMFVGPTGVGKTYLTQCLAEELFGSVDNIIRLDMSEYMEKHTVSRMVGAPPGYVGYEEGGQLTEKVRRKPYSIVLFDEIEKAHPDVFNMLLQMMDEGRLTDGNGITTSFKNTVIILTSNCGTKQVKEFGKGIGFGTTSDSTSDKKQTRSIIEKAIKKQFAPEFLNRIDNVVYFDQLDKEAIQKIVDIELKPLCKRIESLGFQIEITEEAKALLGTKGYDVQFGARPLKRTIQELIEDPLCENLLQGVEAGATFSIQKSEKEEKLEIKIKNKN